MRRQLPRNSGYTRFPPTQTVEVATLEIDKGSRQSQQRRRPMAAEGLAKSAMPVVAAFFVASLFIPVRVDIGPLLLSPSRIVLILTIIPSFILWATGKAGRKNWTDVFIVLLAAWVAVSLFVTEGVGRLPFIGITTIELLAPYLLARCFIRDQGAFYATFRFLFVVAIILGPIAAIESASGIQVISRLLDPLFSVIPWGYYPQRLGLYRAQTVFEHAILYGVVMAFLFSPVFFSFWGRGYSAIMSGLLASPVLVATFFSLSAGAYLGLFVQFMLIGWFFVMGRFPRHWWLLLALVIVGYLIVDVLSNRTPFQVFSSYIAFDQHTAYWRVLIFRFGMENVWEHPLFGLGLADWARPAWMYSASVDNLWLVFAMRHGIPAFVLLSLGYLSAILYLARASVTDRRVSAMRMALVFSLVGLAVCICTVHLWNAALLFMMFMLGVGGWMATDERVTPQGTQLVPRQSAQFRNASAKRNSSTVGKFSG